MRAEIATAAGSAEALNEDWVGVTPTAVVVLDGLTAPGDLDSGCTHGVTWYVSHLGPALLARVADSTTGLASCVAAAIKDVAALHAHTCDLTNPGTPQSTVALVRTRGSELEWLTLADAVTLLDLDGDLHIISDHRVEQTARLERAEALRSPLGTSHHHHNLSQLITAQRSIRNQPGGYWVAAADPTAAHEALTGTVPLATVTRVAVLSDGAARLVEFGLAGWEKILTILDQRGPQGLIDETRRAEETDPRGERWPRYKASDDATAVHIRFQRRK